MGCLSWESVILLRGVALVAPLEAKWCGKCRSERRGGMGPLEWLGRLEWTPPLEWLGRLEWTPPLEWLGRLEWIPPLEWLGRLEWIPEPPTN